MEENTKFCKYCGSKIMMDAVVCPKCGRQIEDIKDNNNPQVTVNNNTTTGATQGKEINKWIAFLLCFFTVCGHKFYEGKVGMGILYLVTGGLFGIGWLVDLIIILGKPDPYYV